MARLPIVPPQSQAASTPAGLAPQVTVFDQPRQVFYEGKWAEPDLSDGSLENWLVRKQRFFLRHLPRSQHARVLDLGCGGGWRVFTRAGQVVGIDMSPRSLQTAATIYPWVAAGDLTHLPFKDSSFDLVVSSDVLGHVPLGEKQQAVEEIFRVLRPGARTVHYVEAEGDDPLTSFAKTDPDLYRRRIIGPEGHEGLDSPQGTFARFRRAGFVPLTETSQYRLLMYPGRLVQLYGNEYAERSRLLGLWVRLARLLTRAAPLELAGNLLAAAALELSDRVLPLSWGSGVVVDYLKPAGSA